MPMYKSAFALLYCASLLGSATAHAQHEGLTVVDESSGQVLCSTHVIADASTYHLRPQEEAKVALKAGFRLGDATAGALSAKGEPIEADWRTTASPGTATPETGSSRLAESSSTESGFAILEASFELIYTAPNAEGLYGLPVRVVLDSGQAQAAGIPEPCLVASTELAVLVGADDRNPQYLFSLNGFYAGAGLARAGAANRGTFRVDEAGKVHGDGTLDLWLDGQCFRSRERQALRVEGWREGEDFHLRLYESGPREKIDDWTSTELSCFLVALQEAGSLLTQAVADLKMGEVTFKVVAPGEEHRFFPDDNWTGSIRGLRR